MGYQNATTMVQQKPKLKNRGSSERPKAISVIKPKFKYKCTLLNGPLDPNIVPLSERKDLPEEAKALLYTPETLPTKEGGLKSSRWYTPPKVVPESAPSTAPKTPSISRSASPVVSDTPSTLNPKAKPFTPILCSTSHASSSIPSTLNPAVKDFTPIVSNSTCSTSPRARSTLNLDVKDFNPIKMSRIKETNKSPIPAGQPGLTSSRWAQPSEDFSTFKTLAVAEQSHIMPLKAQDIPVHLRQHYIPPHLRPIGQKAGPGNPILPYIEPHQRVGILPQVIPNDAEYQPCAVSSKSSISTTEKPETHATESASAIANNTTYLASSWEEFIGTKNSIPAAKPIVAQLGSPLASTTNAVRREIKLPPDCLSSKLSSDRNGPKVERNENKAIAVCWPVQKARISSPGKQSQNTAGEQIEYLEQAVLMEPKVYSTAKLPVVNTNVHQADLEFTKDVQEVILYEIQNPQPAILDLTREALIKETGAAPRDSARSVFDLLVSDDGIEDLSNAVNTTAYAGDSRGYLAEFDTSLQQYDGTWMPVPVDWDEERPDFKGDFIPEFISTWAKTVPSVGGTVDLNRDEFTTGLSPISLLKFDAVVEQPLSYPDVGNSENIHKQRSQTAEIDAKTFAHKAMKRQRTRERRNQIEAQRNPLGVTDFVEEIIVNPNIPKIPIYLRPAQKKDIAGITSIYNHYVRNSIIPEDQTEVTKEDMDALLTDSRENYLPFIVAIKGKLPTGRHTNNIEQVLGYAHTDFYNYGHGGNHKGLSRFTGVVQLFVEPNHTRKGVGRSLLDRILVCSSFSHASKEGYDWVSPDPKDNTVYGPQGGAQRFHQLFIQRPIEAKDDPDHEWLKKWFHGFFIEEAAHLRSVARSSAKGTTARFLDVLTFQFQAAIPGAFDITN